MHRSALADPVDPADALLQTHRVPRQFQIDDQPAGVVQVEPFPCGVGGQQYASRRPREGRQSGGALVARQAPVEHHDGRPEPGADVEQRVTVFREDDRRFAGATKQPSKRRYLRFAIDRRACGGREGGEQTGFTGGIRQAEIRGPRRWFVGGREFALSLVKRERQLLAVNHAGRQSERFSLQPDGALELLDGNGGPPADALAYRLQRL